MTLSSPTSIRLDGVLPEVVERVEPVVEADAQGVLAEDRAMVILGTLDRPVIDVVGPVLDPRTQVATVEGHGRVANESPRSPPTPPPVSRTDRCFPCKAGLLLLVQSRSLNFCG